jgi:hypothetical protein
LVFTFSLFRPLSRSLPFPFPFPFLSRRRNKKKEFQNESINQDITKNQEHHKKRTVNTPTKDSSNPKGSTSTLINREVNQGEYQVESTVITKRSW